MVHSDVLDWARSNQIQPVVFEFLKEYGASSENGFVYVPVDGWKRVSEILRENLSEDALAEIIVVLGDVGANHFLKFRKTFFDMPDLLKILSGTILETSAQFRTDTVAGNMLCRKLTEELQRRFEYIKASFGQDFKSSKAFTVWREEFGNTIRFVANNMIPELVVMFLCENSKKYGLSGDEFVRIPNVFEAMRKFQDLILGIGGLN